VRLIFTLLVRNAQRRNRPNRLERRGYFTEDQTKSFDLAHSKPEATSRKPPMHVRERIGSYAFDVNMHLLRNNI